MIKHTIYLDGDTYSGSFVEYTGLAIGEYGSIQHTIIARSFNSLDRAHWFIDGLKERTEANVCTWYVQDDIGILPVAPTPEPVQVPTEAKELVLADWEN